MYGFQYLQPYFSGALIKYIDGTDEKIRSRVEFLMEGLFIPKDFGIGTDTAEDRFIPWYRIKEITK